MVSLLICRYTGLSDFPSNIIPSYPANFSSGPKWPPELEAPIVPVRGALATTLNLPAHGHKYQLMGLS